LQESVITKVHRLGVPSRRITVTTSRGRDLNGDLARSEVAAERIVDDSCGESVIRIPERAYDHEIMRLAESFPSRFSELGLRISTGPVVMFRATEFLLQAPQEVGSVPLLLPHHVKPFEKIWPVSKNGKPAAFRLCNDSLRLLLPTRNYVLLKRFSAKEEKRRLVAGCLLRAHHAVSHVGIENHLNYVCHVERELSEDEVFGIAAFFNSALLDRYFRTISGSTQVNATEIRAMRFPDLKTLRRIGGQVKRDRSSAEAAVLSELGVATSLRQQLLCH